MKKSQLTLMMIIGIIILLSSVVLFYLFTSQSSKKTQEQITTKQLRQIAIKPIKEYITNCLDITATQGLELVGKQGGRIYTSQGGLTPDPDEFISRENINISYAIHEPEGTVGTTYFSDPPDYPWQNFPGIPESYFGYFGWSSFPPLYETSNFSIQNQVQAYIENNIFDCLDWELFESKGLRFTTGQPSAEMIIAKNITQIAKEDEVSFSLDWPITISDITSDAQTVIDIFTINYPLKLSKFYYFTKSAIDSDVTDISFDINKASTEDFTIKTIQNAKNYDDIIIFKDKDSANIGKPFEFWIARKNRIPALFQINQSYIDSEEICQDSGFSISENGILNTNPSNQGVFPISLKALDPDEENPNFKINFPAGLWKTSTLKIEIRAHDDNNQLYDYQIIEVQGENCE